MVENSRGIKKSTILNGKYKIERVLGEGGFGITYLATDIILKEMVAIKEYFPSTLGTRDTTSAGATNVITIITSTDCDAFFQGLRRFEEETSNLAKFNKEPGIVSVKNFFKENNTGYMVMEYIDGVTLKEYLEAHGGKISCSVVLSMMKPVMDSLAIIHRQSIIHRDISPDNIMVTKDGALKLIDFGAARYVGNDDEKSLTVMLKAGYAPVEQYQTSGHQGTWTDVYALATTMYRMISGQTPIESVARVMEKDTVIPLIKLCPEVPESVSKAIEKGMAVQVEKRCQTIDEFVKALETKNKNSLWSGIGTALALVIGMAIFAGIVGSKTESKKDGMDTNLEESVAQSIEHEENTDIPEKNDVLETIEEPEMEEQEVEELFVPERMVLIQPANFYTDEMVELYTDSTMDRGREFITCLPMADGYYIVENPEDVDFVYYVDAVGTPYEGDKILIHSSALVKEDEYERYSRLLLSLNDKYGIPLSLGEGYVEYGRNMQYSYLKPNADDYGMIECYEYSELYTDMDGDSEKELLVYDQNHSDIIYYADDGIAETPQGVVGDDVETNSSYDETRIPDSLWDEMRYGNAVVAAVYEGGNFSPYVPTVEYFIVDGGHLYELSGVSGLVDYHGWNCFFDADGYCDSNVKVYDNNGTSYLIDWGGGRNYYPTWLLDLQVGECESVEISIDDFMRIPGALNALECAEEQLRKEQYIELVRVGNIVFRVENVKVDSVLYNDVMGFVINYRLEVRLYDDEKAETEYGLDVFLGPWDEDYPFYEDCFFDENVQSNMIGRGIPICDMNGNSLDYDTGIIIKELTGHAYMSFENGKVEYVDCELGELATSSGKHEILVTSDFKKVLETLK